MANSTQSMKQKLRQLASLKEPLPDMDFTIFPATPHEAFVNWFDDAIAAGIREPHAMTLSSIDKDQQPDARVIILKNVDDRGWHFAIKAGSPKAEQIKAQPAVALTFYWPALGRQVRLRGVAKLLSPEECAEDFLDRPIGSRVSAIASKQSEILTSDQELNQQLLEAEVFLIENPQYISKVWQVYAVDPDSVEFWQGASDRNHKRLRYDANPGQSFWKIIRLWP